MYKIRELAARRPFIMSRVETWFDYQISFQFIRAAALCCVLHARKHTYIYVRIYVYLHLYTFPHAYPGPNWLNEKKKIAFENVLVPASSLREINNEPKV